VHEGPTASEPRSANPLAPRVNHQEPWPEGWPGVAECGKCDRKKTSLAALDGMPVDSSRLTDRLRGRRAIPGRIARLPNPARSR
jgi:hypothetical protein